MKIKISFLLYALMLWVVSPVLAQNNGNGNGGGNGSGKGHGHGRGHSDKGGPDDNGSDKGGSDDNGSDKGDHDDKGERHGNSSLLTATTAEVVTALASGTLTTAGGVPIPVSAQVKVYAVLTRKGAAASPVPQLATAGANAGATVKERLAFNFAQLSAPLAAAGPSAEVALPPLMMSLSGLAYNPDWLPIAITDYNNFVQSASASFLANPPPEFVALHAVLAKLTAAAGGSKLTAAAGGR